MRLTRRAAIGAGALAVAACTGSKPRKTPGPTASPTPQAPDAAALDEARAVEARLLASYDHRIRRLPLHKRAPLQVERAIHATHLAALHGKVGRAKPLGNLEAALAASALRLRRLALSASDGTNAALLASIAASHTASRR